MKHKTKHVKKQNLTRVIVLSLIIVTSIGAIGYKIYSVKTRPLPTPIATVNPMAGWLTFSELQYNFSFKFPSNFGQQGEISGPTTGTVSFVRSFTNPKTISNKAGAYFDGFSVYIVTNLKTASFDKYINREIAAMNAAKFTGMKNPTKVTLTNGVALVSMDGKQAYYYLLRPDKKTIVVFAYLQADSAFKETFDQTLSSFEFTDK
jgi:hypothetical protein